VRVRRGRDGDKGYITTYASAVGERVANDPLTKLTSPTIISTSSTPANGSSVTLSGLLASDAFGDSAVKEKLTTTIDVKEGSVILGQVEVCDPTVDIRMVAELRGGNQQRNEVHLCDSYGFNVKHRDSDEVVPGEAVLWASAGGTYDITILSSAQAPQFTKVVISTDPTPTVVSAADAVSKGYTGRVAGPADMVVLLLQTDTTVSWTLAGLDAACGDAQ